MSLTADQTVFSQSPRHDRRKYLSWERWKASYSSTSSSPRRHSCSLPTAEGPASSGPQIAVVLDVVASTRVGRLLRRRFTEVWRRSRHRHRPPRSACNMDGSPVKSSTLLRRAQSAAASTDCSTRPQPTSAIAVDVPPPLGVVGTVTRSTSSLSATQQTAGLMSETADGPSPPTTNTTTDTRTGNTATSTSSLRDQFTSFFQVSDNKLAMKLFGNKNALEKEKLRHKAVGHWVIHPCSDFRLSVYIFSSCH